ncbi:MAG: M48 family metallopeptidase [Sphingobium sp.]|nr:M48 family metallopeptidase [Sphingobium sp.]
MTSSTARSEHSLTLANGERIPLVVLRHAAARRLRLRFDPVKGEAKLTMPPRAALKGALLWAAEQSDWLERQRTRTAEIVRVADGAEIPVEGRRVRIVATGTPGRRVALEEDVMIVGGPAAHAGSRVVRWLKERALEVLTEETQALAKAHGLPLTSVSIGDPRSRWGSCGSSGAIRYSWRLILVPPHVRQAIVAHEVAHLRHMNHSRAFHDFVDAISLADPERARAWLRREGAALHRYRL